MMNDHEILTAVRLAPSGTNLARAADALNRLADWADDNSDGWAYWPKPSRAAANLQELLTERLGGRFIDTGDIDDLTDAELTAALRPVRSFLTRQGVNPLDVLG